MMSLWDALRMNMMISYQELVRTFLNINHDFPNNGNLFNDFLFNHQQDEQLAMAYIAALPFSRPLVYWDGQVLKSTTEIKNYDGSTRVGGEA